jgi:Uma2 family endonuclease
MELLFSHDYTDTIENQYELERGKPMPSTNHSQIQTNLVLALAPYRKEFSFFTELEIELPSGRAVPDVCIYPKITINWRKDIIRRTEAPILAIEILSPRQALDDINTKIDNVYFLDEVKAAWIILPRNQTVLVLTPDGKTRTYTEGVIQDETTGIEIAIKDIFSV